MENMLLALFRTSLLVYFPTPVQTTDEREISGPKAYSEFSDSI